MRQANKELETISIKVKKNLKERIINRSKELGLTITQYLLHLVIQDFQEKEFVEDMVRGNKNAEHKN